MLETVLMRCYVHVLWKRFAVAWKGGREVLRSYTKLFDYSGLVLYYCELGRVGVMSNKWKQAICVWSLSVVSLIMDSGSRMARCPRKMVMIEKGLRTRQPPAIAPYLCQRTLEATKCGSHVSGPFERTFASPQHNLWFGLICFDLSELNSAWNLDRPWMILFRAIRSGIWFSKNRRCHSSFLLRLPKLLPSSRVYVSLYHAKAECKRANNMQGLLAYYHETIVKQRRMIKKNKTASGVLCFSYGK